MQRIRSLARSLRSHRLLMTMMAILLVGFIAAFSAPNVVGAEAKAKAVEAKPNHAAVPVPRIDGWWFIRQGERIDLITKANKAEKAKKPEDEINLLMVGDSITHNFENEKVGLKVWQKYFVPLKTLNLGFGGDRTQHVLWRLDHQPVLKKSPKGAVVMIGTNNMGWGSDTPEQTAGGIVAIVKKLKEVYPDMDVLVLGIFPRREKLNHPHRKRIDKANALLPGLLKGLKGVTFMDIGPKFLDEKGFLSRKMMPDTTHPSEKGHEIWAEAIMPAVKKMLAK